MTQKRGLFRAARFFMGWAVVAGSVGAGGVGAGRAMAAGTEPTARHMIVAAHPLAADAGLAILREGGSAADAAIAAQMVLALVEPQASGLGGGALLLHFAAATGRITSYDGRETAPAAAGPDLFLDRAGNRLDFAAAGIGGRAVGAPGALRMLEALHRSEGHLPWPRLFESAIRLAENGFAVSPRLAGEIAANADSLRRQPGARALFLHANGTPLAAGDVLVNHALADTLRAIALGGSDALNKGAVAAEIATTVRTDANAGLLTADDLAAYTARQREPVCGHYRGNLLCSAGPPSGGGTALLETLGLLGHFDMAKLAAPPDRPLDVDAVHLLIETERLAQADRAMYLADSDFEPVPIRGLLAADYLTSRAQLVAPDHAIADLRAGNPSWDDANKAPLLAPARAQPEHGTSDLAVVDDAGNAVSMTTTVQDPFGSKLLVRGFLLNDELTDFSFEPARDGRPVANRVEPGKRPLSAMTPVIVLDAAGHLRIVAGAAGGGEIPGYVAEALVEMLDFGATPQRAVAAAHVDTTGGAAQLEAGTPAADLAEALRARGHTVQVIPLDSGLAAIEVSAAGLRGGADPRREYVAEGD